MCIFLLQSSHQLWLNFLEEKKKGIFLLRDSSLSITSNKKKDREGQRLFLTSH